MHWLYALHVDIPATDVRVLMDALDGEQLGLTTELGEDELRQQIEAGALMIDARAETRWTWLEQDLEVLSRYLAAPLVAREIAVGDDVRGWRILARGGEVVRIPLAIARADDGQLEVTGENIEELTRQLPDMPRWAQSLLAPRVPRD